MNAARNHLLNAALAGAMLAGPAGGALAHHGDAAAHRDEAAHAPAGHKRHAIKAAPVKKAQGRDAGGQVVRHEPPRAGAADGPRASPQQAGRRVGHDH